MEYCRRGQRQKGSTLMKTNMLCGTVLAMFAVASLTSAAGIVVYPEYDARIERDNAYEVQVSQGGEQRRLTVYNHCEKSILHPRTRGGDVNRRFCEFAFDGGPVRVEIAFCEDVKLDFDLAVTELLSVFFCASEPCDELSFRSMSLVK